MQEELTAPKEHGSVNWGSHTAGQVPRQTAACVLAHSVSSHTSTWGAALCLSPRAQPDAQLEPWQHPEEGMPCVQGQQEGTCPKRERGEVPEGFLEEGVWPYLSIRGCGARAEGASGCAISTLIRYSAWGMVGWEASEVGRGLVGALFFG